MHMLYCCQNHSGSPALTAPVPKKAPTPCATIYGFDAPLQASVDLITARKSLDILNQAEPAIEEIAGQPQQHTDCSCSALRTPAWPPRQAW